MHKNEQRLSGVHKNEQREVGMYITLYIPWKEIEHFEGYLKSIRDLPTPHGGK